MLIFPCCASTKTARVNSRHYYGLTQAFGVQYSEYILHITIYNRRYSQRRETYYFGIERGNFQEGSTLQFETKLAGNTGFTML